MKMLIDTDARELVLEDPAGARRLPLYSDEAFAELSRAWLKVGWQLKYSYSFTWMGRPIIQLPEDVLRIQELIYAVKPDVVIETGVAHGGSLVFYASLFEAMGRGRVVGVDIEIRPANRAAIESHELASRITLVEGSSTAPEVVARVRGLVREGERVLVILDSNHTRAHVLAELEAYGPMVTVGSYIVATDGVMRDLTDVPRGRPSWGEDNPCAAAEEFARASEAFELAPPPRAFDESEVREGVTYWPGAYLRRVR